MVGASNSRRNRFRKLNKLGPVDRGAIPYPINWGRIIDATDIGASVMHSAFVTGFFGFHYVLSLYMPDKDNLHDICDHLERACKFLGIETNLQEHIVDPQDKLIAEMHDLFISTVPEQVGDSFGKPNKWLVRLGYIFGLVFASLSGQIDSDNPEEVKEDLEIVLDKLGEMKQTALNAKLPDVVADTISKVEKRLEKSKDKETAAECRNIFLPVLEKLLSTDIALDFFSHL